MTMRWGQKKSYPQEHSNKHFRPQIVNPIDVKKK